MALTIDVIIVVTPTAGACRNARAGHPVGATLVQELSQDWTSHDALEFSSQMTTFLFRFLPEHHPTPHTSRPF